MTDIAVPPGPPLSRRAAGAVVRTTPVSLQPIVVDVIRDIDDLQPPLSAEWDACVEDAGGDVYFTTDWLRIWWRHNSARRQALFLVARANGRVVGVLPFFVDTFGVPPLRIRMARLAGLKAIFPAIGLPIRAEGRADTLTAMLKALADQRVDAVSVYPLSESDPAIADLDESLSRVSAGGVWDVRRNDAPKKHMIQYLEDSFDAYLGSLSKRRRKGFRQNLAKLTAAMPVANVAVAPDEIDAAFERFAVMHERQWRAAGKGGHFADWRGTRALYRDLVHTLAPSGRAVILEYRGGDRLLASQLGFRIGDRFYWRLCARTLDPDVSGFGPGNLATFAAIDWLIGQKVRVFEDAAGVYDYKESFGGEQAGIRRVLLSRPTVRSRLAAEILIATSRALDFFYYRLWFQRAAPRLRRLFGGSPPPLARAWIRTRL